MKQSEVILKVGSEGGSLAILGERDPSGGWQFLSKRNETALYDMLSEEDRNGITPCERSGCVSSFAEALVLLDRYPWHSLYPLHVHPEFRKAVYDAVVARYKSRNDCERRSLKDWKELCGMPDD